MVLCIKVIIGFACVTVMDFLPCKYNLCWIWEWGMKMTVFLLCQKTDQFLSQADLLHPVPARSFYSCQLWWMDVDEHWVVGTESNRKENRLSDNDLSFLFALVLFPALALGLTDPGSLNQRETKAVKRRRSTSMLIQEVQKCTALAWSWNSRGKRMNCPILQWSATELVQSLCETSLKPVKVNFVVSILLVEHFPSWNIAHQQYLRSLVHSVPLDLWGCCPCCEWMDCMPHSGMLSLQTGGLMCP